MQNCKSILAFVAMLYNQLLHCNVCTLHCSILLEIMMSVLQEIKGLTKELYVFIHSRRKSSFHAKIEVHCSHGLPVLT